MEPDNIYDFIKISYCKKHNEYWINNCSECMAESALQDECLWWWNMVNLDVDDKTIKELRENKLFLEHVEKRGIKHD